MAATVKSGFGPKLVAGRSNTSVTTLSRWRLSVRLWWTDYCAREALRIADDRIIHEAGCRRAGTGRIVPLNHGWPG